MENHSFYMKIAYNEALKACNSGEIPVGSIIVLDNDIIASSHNMVENRNDPTCHAEILAISLASNILGNFRLSKAILYTTLEPCAMCAGAIINSRIKKVVIGAHQPDSGCCGSVIDLLNNPHLNTNVEVKWLYDKNCSDIITKFFQSKRIMKRGYL